MGDRLMPNNYDEQYFNLMSSLADSVIDMSDEEVEEAIRGDGDNVDQIHTVLMDTIKEGRKLALEQARREYEAESERLRTQTYELPQTPAEKRGLIQKLIESLSFGQQELTLQFCEYESMPDEDLDGALKQLLELQSDTEKLEQ
ncbi:MAG: hypothetical protein IPM50_03240 [Acidobacteriota bacterium]|nr:MAG: hypothetical protein IPM50_03240 [Acidobacteriota bacterium]